MNNTPPQPPQQEKSNASTQDQGGRVAFQAMLMALGTLLSRILGLVRESLFAALFSKTVTDAWYVAFRLPNVFRRLFGEGSLAVAFIPVFVESRLGPDGQERSTKLVNNFYTLFFFLLASLTLIGVLFPELLLNVFLDENFKSVPGKFELTTQMARIMFVYIFLVCTYAYFMAILNAIGKFGLAALAPSFFNICVVISTLIPTTLLQWEGQSLAWGVVIGGLVQAGILVPLLRKSGYWPRISFEWNNQDVKKVLRAMGPGLLGLGLLQLTTLVNMRFASSFGEGPISYINYADRLLELPLSLVSVSIGSALLPTLSLMWSQGRTAEMSKTAQYYLRLNLFICVPAAVGLYFLAEPIVALLFQRGRFSMQDAAATAGVVKIYSGLIITTSLVRVFVPSFYAIKNTWLPATVSGLCFLLHLVTAQLLMARFGFYGLNLSTVVSTSLNFILLALAYRKLIGPFGWWGVAKSAAQFFAMAAVMGLILQSHAPLFLYIQQQGFGLGLSRLISLAVVIAAAAFCYLGLSSMLQLQEYTVTANAIKKKIQNKLKKK